jgi:hypothetical protein
MIGFLCLLAPAAFVRDRLDPDRPPAKLGLKRSARERLSGSLATSPTALDALAQLHLPDYRREVAERSAG